MDAKKPSAANTKTTSRPVSSSTASRIAKEKERRKKPAIPTINSSSRRPEANQIDGPKMDFSSIDDTTLRRYRHLHKIKIRNGQYPNRDELVNVVSRHFDAQDVNEKDVLTYFIYTLRTKVRNYTEVHLNTIRTTFRKIHEYNDDSLKKGWQKTLHRRIKELAADNKLTSTSRLRYSVTPEGRQIVNQIRKLSSPRSLPRELINGSSRSPFSTPTRRGKSPSVRSAPTYFSDSRVGKSGGTVSQNNNRAERSFYAQLEQLRREHQQELSDKQNQLEKLSQRVVELDEEKRATVEKVFGKIRRLSAKLPRRSSGFDMEFETVDDFLNANSEDEMEDREMDEFEIDSDVGFDMGGEPFSDFEDEDDQREPIGNELPTDPIMSPQFRESSISLETQETYGSPMPAFDLESATEQSTSNQRSAYNVNTPPPSVAPSIAGRAASVDLTTLPRLDSLNDENLKLVSTIRDMSHDKYISEALYNNTISELENKLSTLQNQLAPLLSLVSANTVESAHEAVANLMKESERVGKDLARVLFEFEAYKVEALRSNERYETEKQALKEELKCMEVKLQELNTAMTTLMEESEVLKIRVQNKELELSAVQEINSNRVERMERELVELCAVIASKERDINTLLKEKYEVDVQAAESGIRIKHLEGAIEEFKFQKFEMEKQKSLLELEVSGLKQRLEEQTIEIQEKDNKVRDFAAKEASLESRGVELIAAIEGYKAEIERLEANILELNEKSKQASDSLQVDLQNREAMLTGEINELNAKMDHTLQQLTEFEVLYLKEKSMKEDLEIELERLRSDVEERSGRVVSLESAIVDLNKNLDNGNGVVDGLKQELQKLKDEKEAMDSKFIAEIEELKRQLSDSTKREKMIREEMIIVGEQQRQKVTELERDLDNEKRTKRMAIESLEKEMEIKRFAFEELIQKQSRVHAQTLKAMQSRSEMMLSMQKSFEMEMMKQMQRMKAETASYLMVDSHAEADKEEVDEEISDFLESFQRFGGVSRPSMFSTSRAPKPTSFSSSRSFATNESYMSQSASMFDDSASEAPRSPATSVILPDTDHHISQQFIGDENIETGTIGSIQGKVTNGFMFEPVM
ncbi:hypothetical protein HK098_003399 [Nowakowskiella sp. JEL0407]|nr:hypothetical protein HK098_003399 [Nowakowskiella sp. JEL0407]